jgi:hypothetical protein
MSPQSPEPGDDPSSPTISRAWRPQINSVTKLEIIGKAKLRIPTPGRFVAARQPNQPQVNASCVS